MNMHYLLKAALLSVALSGPATAAVYTGIWDPQFGAPFSTELGWRGTATFSVPDSCVLPGTGTVINGSCGGTAVLTSASVELYDIDGPADLLAKIVFNPASMTISNLHYVLGDLEQLDTSASALEAPVAEPLVNLGVYGLSATTTTFALQFTTDGPRLHFLNCPLTTDCTSGSNDPRFAPQFTITRVPEPASLALAALALAGLGALRRRRAAA